MKGLSLVSITTSSLGHSRWLLLVRQLWLVIIDHCSICIMVHGCYTNMYLLVVVFVALHLSVVRTVTILGIVWWGWQGPTISGTIPQVLFSCCCLVDSHSLVVTHSCGVSSTSLGLYFYETWCVLSLMPVVYSRFVCKLSGWLSCGLKLIIIYFCKPAVVNKAHELFWVLARTDKFI